MGGKGGGTRRNSESGSIREVLPRARIYESPTTKEGGSEMWQDRGWGGGVGGRGVVWCGVGMEGNRVCNGRGRQNTRGREGGGGCG